MKSTLLIALLFFTVDSFSDPGCPGEQDVITLNQTYDINLKAKNNVRVLMINKGKSEVYNSSLTSFNSYADNLNISKGQDIKLVFTKEDFYKTELDQERTVNGELILEGKKERVDFVINDRKETIPTFKELEYAIGDEFLISCKPKQNFSKIAMLSNEIFGTTFR